MALRYKQSLEYVLAMPAKVLTFEFPRRKCSGRFWN